MRKRRDDRGAVAQEEAERRGGEEERRAEADGAEEAAGAGEEAVLAADLEALRQQLQAQEQAAEEAQDRFLRAMADFDNYRKRQNAAIEDARRFANESLIADLLPVLDNFERALETGEPETAPKAFTEGVRLIHRQLFETLRKAGLERIEAKGQLFDPAVHEAIMQQPPAPGQEPHQVIEELRPGYKLNGRILRASLVKVTSG